MAAAEDRPFFSIIIPTNNRAPFLVQSLSSLLAQDFLDYEIIVVDDGSTDNTREVVLQRATGDTRIKYFHKENEERSIARNYGIVKASGKYIGFLDSDDIAYNNHLTIAYELLKRNGFPEVGHLGYKLIDTEDSTISVMNSFDDSFKEKLIHENTIHGNAIFIRADIAREIQFIPSPAAILSEDWYLWLRLASRYRFHFDNTVTTAVVQHADRSLLNLQPDKLIASTNVVVEYLQKDKLFLREYRGKVSYHLANHYTFLALMLALTKVRRWEVIVYLVKAIQFDPRVVIRKRFLAAIKHWF